MKALLLLLWGILLWGCQSKPELSEKQKSRIEIRSRMKPHEILFAQDTPEDSARTQQVHLLAKNPEFTDIEEFTTLSTKAFCNYNKCKIWMWDDRVAFGMFMRGTDTLKSEPVTQQAFWKEKHDYMAAHLLATFVKGEPRISRHFIFTDPTYYSSTRP